MADKDADKPGEQKPDPFVDGEITSVFPAGGVPLPTSPNADTSSDASTSSDADVAADADSWVDEWASLFDDQDSTDDEPPKSNQPPTTEMPVLSAEQPPVGIPVDRELPGHPDPAAAARARAEEKAKQEAKAAAKEQADEQAKAAADAKASVEATADTQAPAKVEPSDESVAEEKENDKANRDAAEMAAWQKAQERSKRRAKLRANQRKAQVMQRQLPEPDDLRIDRIEEAPPLQPVAERRPSSRVPVIVGGVLLVALAVVAGYVFTGFGTGSDDDAAQDAATEAGGPADDLDLQVGADVTPRGISDLAMSTVQLLGLNDALEPECAGSGVIVRSDGTILTNAHVVTSQESCEFSVIGVGITVDSSSPSQLLYRADVLAVDEALDLAVLKISGVLDPDAGGARELPDSFPAAPLGDSDTVELGDNMRILGYPVIGGETITLTTGTVSGFTSQAGVGVRALIKTDATISAGNSGGMAVDPDGRMIGIPTKARASESGPAIDCRPLADTNDDGAVDEADNCVSVGGFLNGIRPINLALPLLAVAATNDPLGAVVEQDDPAPDIDFDQVAFGNPRFALGRDGNTPVDEVITAQSGIAELCFFVDWQGIPAGSGWDGVWFVNGVLEENLGFTDQEWTIEEDGRNFWLCAQEQNALGLPAGVYEIGFFLEGMLLFVEGIELTEEPVDVAEITWTNDTDGEICELAINPLADSGQVGLNELGDGVSIPPDGSRTIELPIGLVVAEAYNCEGEPVADAFDGLEIEGPATFLIGL